MNEKGLQRVIVITKEGRYIWWEGLSVVEFYPKGKSSRPTDATYLTSKRNTYDGAMRATARMILDKYPTIGR